MANVGIVTGAGRGMGLACARRLAAMVDILLLVDLDEASVTAAAKELTASGSAAEPVVLDVTDRDGLSALRWAARGAPRRSPPSSRSCCPTKPAS
jgi:NAD(P)-dependent dehydrogenase (short-subunit alcohol dehydrogenase family)